MVSDLYVVTILNLSMLNNGFLSKHPPGYLLLFCFCKSLWFMGFSGANSFRKTGLSPSPGSSDRWTMQQEGVVEKEIQDVLKADEFLTRSYVSVAAAKAAHFFVAYFHSQRTGQTPHSPKNCLPGSGWIPSVSDVIHIPFQGRTEPIETNRYVVAKGDQKSLVLYWYQSRDRVVASEYKAKFLWSPMPFAITALIPRWFA